MKRKIALIDSVAARGGSHHLYLFGQSIGLINREYKVYLYTNDLTKDPDIKGLVFHQFYKGIFGRTSNFIAGLLYCVGSIRSILHASFNGIEICHFHLFHVNILVLFDLILIKILRMKAVYTIHDVVSNLEKNKSNKILTKFVLKLANKIITHNTYSQIEISNIFDMNINDVAIIPHGNYIPFISTESNSDKSRSYLEIPKKRKVLLFFGMIKRIKGLEVLLEALKKIKEKVPDILLVVAGKSWEDDFSIYQNLINKYNLNKHCLVHHEYIPNSKIGHYFASSNLVVLPYKRISQSGVLMMSCSYGKAVLCSNLKPFLEVLEDNSTGFFFESENPNSLANKVIEIFEDEQFLTEVSKSSFELISTKYSWKNIGEMLDRQYEILN